MGQNQETRIIGHQTQTLAPLSFGPPNPLVAMTQMPGRRAKDQQRQPLAAPPRHIIEPLPHRLDPREIMMPPEQRLETRIILRANLLDLQLIQNGLFFDLWQTIWLRHPRNLKKLAPGVQSKVKIPLPRAVFHFLMSQPCSSQPLTICFIRDALGNYTCSHSGAPPDLPAEPRSFEVSEGLLKDVAKDVHVN